MYTWLSQKWIVEWRNNTKGMQGGEEFPKHYFSITDGFILVYAVNRLESFQRVDKLKKEIDEYRDKKEVTT